MTIEIKSIQGKESYDGFGYSTTFGDVNGDGINELIVSSPNKPAGGSINIYNIDNNKLLKSFKVGKKKVNSIRLIAADVNNDHVDEIIAGITYQDLSGEVKVISLKENKILHRWESPLEYDAFGFSLAVGDINGDQHLEILVGAPQPIKDGKGKVYIYHPEDGRLIREITSKIPRGGSDFATTITTADVNHDGIDEIVIGAPGLPKGEVYIYSGTQGWLQYKLTGDPGFGVMVHADDINNDGFIELLITTKNFEGNKVSIYQAPYYQHLYDIENEDIDIGFGEVLTTADLNGDGRKEIIIGAYDSHHNRKRFAGQVNVYQGLDGALLHRWYGQEEKEQFGFSLSAQKAMNNQADSLLIGAPREMLRKKGKVYLVNLVE